MYICIYITCMTECRHALRHSWAGRLMRVKVPRADGRQREEHEVQRDAPAWDGGAGVAVEEGADDHPEEEARLQAPRTWAGPTQQPCKCLHSRNTNEVENNQEKLSLHLVGHLAFSADFKKNLTPRKCPRIARTPTRNRNQPLASWGRNTAAFFKLHASWDPPNQTVCLPCRRTLQITTCTESTWFRELCDHDVSISFGIILNLFSSVPKKTDKWERRNNGILRGALLRARCVRVPLGRGLERKTKTRTE